MMIAHLQARRRRVAFSAQIIFLAVVLASSSAVGQDDAKFVARCLSHLAGQPKPDIAPVRAAKRPDRHPCWQLQQVHYADGANVNKQAQLLHGVPTLRGKPYFLSGKNITVAVLDGGHVLSAHVEFGDRVSLQDLKSAAVYLSGHATHVAGTIAAIGHTERAQGMAPAARVLSYHWSEDITKLTSAAALGATVSNHSYGIDAGWSYEADPSCPVLWHWNGRDRDADSLLFGRYDEDAAEFDRIALANPALSIFASAGNARNWIGEPYKLSADYFDGRHCVWKDRKWTLSSERRASHSRKGGFDTLAGKSVAKNVVTVGAMTDLKANWRRDDIRLEPFSSFGPTDDGRVKPDVIANGAMLYSTAVPKKCEDDAGKCDPGSVPDNQKQGYVAKSGTSMASPVAAGIATLLNELAIAKRRRALFSDEMKAVLIHTAASKLINDGPTYDAGWGVIQSVPAARLVAGERGALERRIIKRGETLTLGLEWQADTAARVTVVWLDTPATVVPEADAIVDDAAELLVDRLSVTLLAPDKTEFFPWSLDAKSPERAPVNTKPNRVDNVLRFDVPTGRRQSGIWHLKIDADAVRRAEVSVALAYSALQPMR